MRRPSFFWWAARTALPDLNQGPTGGVGVAIWTGLALRGHSDYNAQESTRLVHSTMPVQALQLLSPTPDRRPVRSDPPPGIPLSELDGGEALLERLRKAARRARCGRHMTLSEAHRWLACPGAASGAAEVLVRTLGEALGQRPVFHAPGSATASFDEAWLVRLHRAQAARDVDSVALLAGRRVPLPLRRRFLDLLRAV